MIFYVNKYILYTLTSEQQHQLQNDVFETIFNTQLIFPRFLLQILEDFCFRFSKILKNISNIKSMYIYIESKTIVANCIRMGILWHYFPSNLLFLSLCEFTCLNVYECCVCKCLCVLYSKHKTRKG